MLAYALVTPARDERENLLRLADCLVRQTQPPTAWVIVDNGSTDGSRDLAEQLAADVPWIQAVSIPPPGALERGAPIVRAFHRGIDELVEKPDVVVKLDADTSMEPTYFERLIHEFELDPRLGIASGGGQERGADGAWRERKVAPGCAWGASRAYRWELLAEILPLEESMGWDGIDQLKGELRGWRTRTISEIPFRHHRVEGERDGRRGSAWDAHGRASYYMGYRPTYLVLRALHHARREPAALRMISGYFGSLVRRRPRVTDEEVRRYLRRQQSVRRLSQRHRSLRQTGTY